MKENRGSGSKKIKKLCKNVFFMFMSVFVPGCGGLNVSNPMDEINLEETDCARGSFPFSFTHPAN